MTEEINGVFIVSQLWMNKQALTELCYVEVLQQYSFKRKNLSMDNYNRILNCNVPEREMVGRD